MTMDGLWKFGWMDGKQDHDVLQTNKQTNSVFITPLSTAMTTYNEAVCHAGQHKKRKNIYNAYIAPCQDTQSAQT